MIHKVFTVYDSKAEAYMQPFFSPTTGLAIRSFSEVANNKDHAFSKYPEDYTLFEIGEFNDIDGSIKMLDAKKSIGIALDYVQQV